MKKGHSIIKKAFMVSAIAVACVFLAGAPAEYVKDWAQQGQVKTLMIVLMPDWFAENGRTVDAATDVQPEEMENPCIVARAENRPAGGQAK